LGELGFAVEGGEAVEELVVWDAVGRWGRDFEEDVEVVGHEAVGEDSAAGEGFAFAHDFAEVFAFVVFEDEAAVDDAGDAVVECGFGGGVFPGGEEAFAVVGAHGRREADGVGGGQGVFEKKSGRD
jgi:hypothetical protein